MDDKAPKTLLKVYPSIYTKIAVLVGKTVKFTTFHGESVALLSTNQPRRGAARLLASGQNRPFLPH